MASPNKRLAPFVVLTVSLFLRFPPTAQASPEPFGREAFRRVAFSGHCEPKQWSLTPDNALSLRMGASPDGPCRVALDFQSPLPISERSALSFELRGSQPGQEMAIGMTEEEDEPEDAARSRRFGVSKEWRSDGLRLGHLKRGWSPKALARLSFVAYPVPDASGKAVLYIRNIRLIRLRPAVSAGGGLDPEGEALAPSSAPEEPVVVQMEEPIVAPVATIPVAKTAPPLFSLRWLMRRAIEILGMAGACWIAGIWWMVLRRRRALPEMPFSPLYEMNTRTWKSRRDTEGVLHIGGFNRITLADLKAIKAKGFNSIWFMGVWEIGPKVRAISRRYGDDYAGSPFAINNYHVSEELGTEDEFRQLVERARAAGLKVILDFVPNHMGLDSAWLNEHPEFFIHRVLDEREAALADEELQSRYPGYFVYRTPSYPQGGIRVPKTILVAYGKDPYFYPWIDTAQLDYAVPGLRRKMIDILSRWAKVVDGVRCDMAMLALREQVKVHRHPDMSWEAFNRLMPEEFWSEAIRSVRRVNPSFLFIAETYWSMEGFLQQLGFDYTYNKPLYEAMCHAFHNGHAEGLLNFLRLLGTDFLKKGVHFLENHDEERAMNALGEERQRAAATLMCTLPGIVLIHQGQMEGHRERLPVQRAVPLHMEAVNADLQTFYSRLFEATALPLFRHGRLHVLHSNNPALVTYARIDDEMQSLVVINASNRPQKGSVFLMPGLKLKTGAPYKLHDLFYELKNLDRRRHPTVQPSYNYSAAALINQGLYVELQPFDAHIFLFEPRESYQVQERVKHFLRGLNEGWPLPRVARRLLGPVLVRSSDQSLPSSKNS